MFWWWENFILLVDKLEAGGTFALGFKYFINSKYLKLVSQFIKNAFLAKFITIIMRQQSGGGINV